MSDLAGQSGSPRALVILTWVAVLVGGPAAARAQVPVIEDHRFVPSSLATWSFVDTQVSSTSEAGVTDFVVKPDVQVPVVQVPQNVDGSFLEVDQTVYASFAFAGIVSVNGQLSAGGILPRDNKSSVVVGGHGTLAEGFGAALRIVRSGPFQMTVRADFKEQQVESVIPALLPSSPRVSGSIRGVRPAVAAALAVSPSVGLQGSFVVDWQHFDVQQTDDVTSVSGAIAATFSLKPLPLTLLVGGSVMHEFGLDTKSITAEAVFGPNQTNWNVEGGVYFIARPELDLGLLLRDEVFGGDHNTRVHGVFRLAYYF